MEIAFAGLHTLCAPMLRRLRRLPDPRREALSTAFGMSGGPPPDRFLVGLAVLSLLADTAEERPLICIVDDAQWLDRVSAQTLAFVSRRLLAERVGLVFALRESGDEQELDGLPELVIEGLAAADAAGCWPRRSPARSTRECRIGSSARRAATRSRCSSCRAGGSRSRSRADSGCPVRCR